MSINTDIVVVGGGMVGALTTVALARSGLDVVLIEQRLPKSFKEENYDLRVSALSVASERMLKTAGAWRGISEMRVCAYRRMLVWDSETKAKTQFDSSRIGWPHLGHIVENSVIQLALWQQLQKMKNVVVYCPASIGSVEFQADQVSVYTDRGQINGSLLVAADGAASAVRKMSGIAVEEFTYDQHALVATVHTEYAQQDITWQRFTPGGPQAFLPLTGARASIVWYESPENVNRLKQLDGDEFVTAMTRSFPQALGGIDSVCARGSFPLQWQHAENYVIPRLALVGDAAHSVHPLAGQGVNLGLLDAGALVDCVVDSHHSGTDIGCMRTLRRYERWRRPANGLMINFLDNIQRAFQPGENREWFYKGLRNFALRSANHIGPLNKVCMKTAMGLTGDLPRLARGRVALES